MKAPKRPPIGAVLGIETWMRVGVRKSSYGARVRWTHPTSHHREQVKASFSTVSARDMWLADLERAAKTGIDSGQTLGVYVHSLGDRWARTIDRTSTYDPYAAGLNRRVMPSLGHLPVGMLGLIDRAIDQWEMEYGASTVKNTVAALVLVLDEAVRDGLLTRNPAKDRARRTRANRAHGHESDVNPRELALPDVATLNRLVEAVADKGGHQCWGDMVTLLATTAMRFSEVSGLQVRDIDLEAGLIEVRRQTYPGRGGLVTKATKGRRRRRVPIIAPVRPTLERLTVGRDPEARLITGPRGGVITTATLRDATKWDQVVAQLGLVGLVRHGLRHTALTWMADSGVPLYVLQRVAGHQDPAVTGRYLHPDSETLTQAGTAFSNWWAQSGPTDEAAPAAPVSASRHENGA